MTIWRQTFPQYYVVLAVDANARVGSARENANGVLVISTLEVQKMLAVNTFTGAEWTGQPSNGGKPALIDSVRPTK
eukprot:8359433-Pyramimonas_sp.AAC.1